AGVRDDPRAQGQILVGRLRELGPVSGLNARNEFRSAISIRLEDRGLALADVEPVLAERIHDVRLVRDEYDVRARGRGGRGEFLHRGRAAVVLIRRGDKPGLRAVRSRRTRTAPQPRAGLRPTGAHAGT